MGIPRSRCGVTVLNHVPDFKLRVASALRVIVWVFMGNDVTLSARLAHPATERGCGWDTSTAPPPFT
ncbi:hypothetical protein E2562_017850 [Oryza meyeriana var. granulata]|uniref:Uncharacterized protein n=1 Tax=Oryza meyeriana var. granulata TaxID=110450 RepID=A0A6G1DXR9_9ORYZ|nr:hypothetical protein E2562_017850 [Oryza meyeriana var. granulata]